MLHGLVRNGCIWLLALAAWSGLSLGAGASPRIADVSLRGLQAGGVTTLVITGSQLLPQPNVMLSAPVAKLTVKDGATAERLEVEVTLDSRTPAGIYLLRVGSSSGISDAVAVGVDNLVQLAVTKDLAATNVALSGAISGTDVVSTTFAGKKDQRVVVEVEARRLGSGLKPAIHLYDARRKQLAWSQNIPSIAGDARLAFVLPADGPYTVELHDSLYQGANPGFFRLKIGDFHYADLVYPLAVQQGTAATLEFASTDLPADARSTATWPKTDALNIAFQPAPWPALPLISGSRPVVMITEQPEVLEAPEGEKLQEIAATPVAVNGRLAKPGEQDRYRLTVSPGSQIRFDVVARRAGSPLDGVLSIQNEQGAELAANDDRPGNSDPGLDFKVPDGVGAIVLALRDLEGRGGADFIYRIAISPLGTPDFTLALTDDRYLVPKDGVALVRVKADRAGYEGPIKLDLANLPPSVSVTGNEIPAGASQALVTISAPGLDPTQALARIVGSTTEGTVRRAALPPRDTVNRHQPWLADEVGVAVTTPAPLAVLWELYSSETSLALGAVLPIKVRIDRAADVKGAVRLSLVTTQVTPRKRVKVNNQDRDVDDVDRTIRFESTPMIAADQNEVAVNLLVPDDLPQIAYDLAIDAELLGKDNKKVVATVATPARRLGTSAPIAVALAANGPVEVRAGLGPSGKLTGKIVRADKYTQPVELSLDGLPKGLASPRLVVAADKSDFEFPLAFPYGTAPGELKGVKLSATSRPDAKNPKLVLRAKSLDLALNVVPGEKPPVEQPLAIFEDQPEFVSQLDQGGGQATLNADEKYSGAASIKVTPDQKFNPMLPGLGLKIRENPQPGEYRYLRFAWKKQGGQALCLQLGHDGQWGPSEGKPAKFRYHAGPGGECFGASVAIDGNLPTSFAVVTRDLFADFGEFTLQGLALSPVDGEFALFDHIYLARTPEELELVKPK